MQLRYLLTIIAAMTVAAVWVGTISAQQPTTMDAATKLITDAQTHFANIRDYTGMFYKQERINGQLNPEQTIQITARNQPFAVHMKWVGPKTMAGQEACYAVGKNNNMLRAKAASGLAAALGFVSIDPKDPRALATNRRPITDSGMGNMIESLASQHHANCKRPDQVSIAFAEYRFLQKPCIRLESTQRKNDGSTPYYRKVVFFDKESHLPVRVENYDWPKQGGPPGGELLECYSYVDLKFNVGLTDEAFNY